MESLLFHFLDDWLYKFSADLFFVPRVSLLLSQLLMNKCYLYERGAIMMLYLEQP